MTDLTLESLREELKTALDPLRAQLMRIEAHIDGIAITNHALIKLQHDVRLLQAAFNDLAKSNATRGEVRAPHDNLDKSQGHDLVLRTVLNDWWGELGDPQHAQQDTPYDKQMICPTGKIPHRTHRRAFRHLRDLSTANPDAQLNVYKCGTCGAFHVGS